jgi:hypothetical protein
MHASSYRQKNALGVSAARGVLRGAYAAATSLMDTKAREYILAALFLFGALPFLPLAVCSS